MLLRNSAGFLWLDLWNMRVLCIYYLNRKPMKGKLDLSIPIPCTEKWGNFSKTRKGGYCSSCRKEVIDFTILSDAEVIVFFKERREPICGRLRTDQMKSYRLSSSSKSLHPFYTYFISLILLLFAKPVSSQQKAKTPTEQRQPEEKQLIISTTTKPERTVKGIVRSVEDQSLLPGVNVMQKGTIHGTVTDANGFFSLTLTDWGSSTLVFSFIGLETSEVTIAKDSLQNELLIEMNLDVTVLGGVVYMGGIHTRKVSPRRWWWAIKSRVMR